MRTRTLRDLEPASLRGRRCLVRADFNVPLTPDGAVSDDTRIRAVVPTLEYLTEAGARVIVLSHLGRPDGRPDPAFSLRPTIGVLGDLVSAPVHFVEDTLGDDARSAVAQLSDGEILVLENTRFLPGETSNDTDVSAALASFAELFVAEAFGAAHRAHASTVGAAERIRAGGGEAVAGFLMERELRYLRDTLNAPVRPFVAILGGAKISGKIDVVEAMLPRVDRLLIGGAMANTFIQALGFETGDSLVEVDRLDMARELMERAGDQLVLPVDFRAADELADESITRVVARDAVRPGELIGDIGPVTERTFAAEIAAAQTVVWNGPMGVFEMEPFASGTFAIAAAAAAAADAGATVIVGGGDSAAAVVDSGVAEKMSHISTGGGAALELLAGADLPGVSVLSQVETPPGAPTAVPVEPSTETPVSDRGKNRE